MATRWAPPIGIQTIIWGPRPFPELEEATALKRMLEEARTAGYQGVEFHQTPDIIGDPGELYRVLKRNRLHFLGLAGGPLHEKMTFLSGFLDIVRRQPTDDSHALRCLAEPPYVYVEEWEGQAAEAAIAQGFTLALHPHMFRAVQTAQDAELLLQEHVRLRFLPDTAHLTVAGEDVVEMLRRNFERIEAVHLKDWTAEFGRAYQFYSRGFVELGEGDVELPRILTFLREKAYSRWLVVEQDAADRPAESASKSFRWLTATINVQDRQNARSE